MRIERQYYKFTKGETEEEDTLIPCERIDATSTKFIFLDTLPNGEEYGLSALKTEVLDEVPEYMLEVLTGAMGKYATSRIEAVIVGEVTDDE